MADTMQFIRELLEGQQPGTAVRGMVTHAVRVPTEDVTDPPLYDLQLLVNGYTYTGMVFTRDPQIPTPVPGGIEVLVSKPEVGKEGYPVYLYMMKAQTTPQQPLQQPSPLPPQPQPQQTQVAPPHAPHQAPAAPQPLPAMPMPQQPQQQWAPVPQPVQMPPQPQMQYPPQYTPPLPPSPPAQGGMMVPPVNPIQR